ncbi:zinc finger MYM-type protein 5-like, partial [Acyrthosiphon pisum]|uniref:TTF-type domain-containing protein n=1 Tax=Acyrthosiphon pisum TaxID=7029 RepID=A0A8R2JW70_ACYPI
PYLFIDTVLTPQIIRTLVEIGPCQPGFNSNNYVFEENECGKKFSPNWYNKNVKSGMSCKRNWLVFSPKANKMFCFPCFLFRSVSQHSYQWSNPNKGVSNFRKGNEKIIKHEKSKDHRVAENEYLILKSRISKDITIQQNLMKVQKSQIEFNRSVLKRLIDLSLFLSTNGLPFRGHREDINQDTQSIGLFIEIVKLVSKYDAVLAKHLAESNRNETYLSPKI